MMKYSHKPQPNSPLEKELAVKQLENVTFVSRFDENWIVVRSEAGEEGCVPDKYVMVCNVNSFLLLIDLGTSGYE